MDPITLILIIVFFYIVWPEIKGMMSPGMIKVLGVVLFVIVLFRLLKSF